MNAYLLIGGLITIAYICQILLGLKQIKHFNQVYACLRKQGKVAIGRRPGKIKSGTIAMFAIDANGDILDAKIMQGVTVLAKFKDKGIYIGENINNLTEANKKVQKENKLTQQAIIDARNLYLAVASKTYHEPTPLSPFTMIRAQLSGIFKKS